MKNKDVEIIKLLLENREKELSINAISRLLKKDYKNVHNMITRLAKNKVISLDQFGNSHRVVLGSNAHPLIFEAEYLRRDEILKNKDIAIMLDSFRSLRSKFFILLLFGSYAKKTQTRHSDIDLMFIVPNGSEELMEKEMRIIARTLPLKIHLNIFKESDFMSMRKSKETTVGSEAMRSNIILHGIGQYYEMIQ